VIVTVPVVVAAIGTRRNTSDSVDGVNGVPEDGETVEGAVAEDVSVPAGSVKALPDAAPLGGFENPLTV